MNFAYKEWQEIVIAKKISFIIPKHSQWNLTEEGYFLADINGSGSFIIDKHRLNIIHDSATSLFSELEILAKDFTKSICSSGNESHIAEYARLYADNYIYIQAVTACRENPDKKWLFRLASNVGIDHYYILHWNGDAKFIKTAALPIMESFQILD